MAGEPTERQQPGVPPAETPAPRRGLRFPRRMRLSRDLEYQAVYAAKARVFAGPLIVFARPNDLGHPRLGLAVGRRVGNAVVRNRIKRRLREAFRLSADDLPAGYDLVIRVRPHEPLPLAEYQRLWASAWRKLHRRWTSPPPPRRSKQRDRPAPPPAS